MLPGAKLPEAKLGPSVRLRIKIVSSVLSRDWESRF